MSKSPIGRCTPKQLSFVNINKRKVALETLFHSFTCPSFPYLPSDCFSSFTKSHRRLFFFKTLSHSFSRSLFTRWTSAHSSPPLHTFTYSHCLILTPFTFSLFLLSSSFIQPLLLTHSRTTNSQQPFLYNLNTTTTTALPQQLIPQWLAESWCVPKFIHSLFFLFPMSSQHTRRA